LPAASASNGRAIAAGKTRRCRRESVLYAFAILAVFLSPRRAVPRLVDPPLSVILVVPLGLLGVVSAITLRGSPTT